MTTELEAKAVIRAALQPWERRSGDFSAGDAATDVLAVLLELGLVRLARDA